MTLWWMQPGWAETPCCECGDNIKASGGDPDWGRCYPCFSRLIEGSQDECRESVCHICNAGIAVTERNGWGVCSADCDHEAQRRGEKNAYEKPHNPEDDLC